MDKICRNPAALDITGSISKLHELKDRSIMNSVQAWFKPMQSYETLSPELKTTQKPCIVCCLGPEALEFESVEP